MIRTITLRLSMGWVVPRRYYSPRGRKSPKETSGIGRRMQVFDQHNMDFDELESDFMNTHMAEATLKSDQSQHRDKLGSWIVKKKFFRSPSLNLLTYSEKEQIRHLHDKDKGEWTVEKLAGSFPASQETILKLIRNKWVMRDSKRIDSHDQKVQRNWNFLKTGKVPEIDQELRKHLLQFVDRKIESHTVSEEIVPNRKPIPGEFSDMITRCRKGTPLRKEHRTKDIREAQDGKEMITDGPMVIELFHGNSGLLRLEQETEKCTVNADMASSGVGHRPDTSKAPVSAPTMFRSKGLEHRESITIPTKLRKKGVTYKLGDSYFDDDGVFMFRVPGMN